MSEITRMQKLAGIHNQMIEDSYDLIIESIDLNNRYDFEHTNRNRWIFKDRIGSTHFTVVNKSLDTDNACEIKFGWIDKNGQKRYDKPITYDERIFNTHIYIILNEIIPAYKDSFRYILLKATDELRYRLYRMNIDKFVDKNEFDVNLEPQNNTIVLDNKNFDDFEKENNPYLDSQV